MLDITLNPPLIFDDGPDSIDRYTVFPQHGPWAGNRTQYLGCSEGGRAFSEWGELPPGDDGSDLEVFGRQVSLDELDHDTQSHILARLMEDR